MVKQVLVLVFICVIVISVGLKISNVQGSIEQYNDEHTSFSPMYLNYWRPHSSNTRNEFNSIYQHDKDDLILYIAKKDSEKQVKINKHVVKRLSKRDTSSVHLYNAAGNPFGWNDFLGLEKDGMKKERFEVISKNSEIEYISMMIQVTPEFFDDTSLPHEYYSIVKKSRYFAEKKNMWVVLLNELLDIHFHDYLYIPDDTYIVHANLNEFIKNAKKHMSVLKHVVRRVMHMNPAFKSTINTAIDVDPTKMKSIKGKRMSKELFQTVYPNLSVIKSLSHLNSDVVRISVSIIPSTFQKHVFKTESSTEGHIYDLSKRWRKDLMYLLYQWFPKDYEPEKSIFDDHILNVLNSDNLKNSVQIEPTLEQNNEKQIENLVVKVPFEFAQQCIEYLKREESVISIDILENIEVTNDVATKEILKDSNYTGSSNMFWENGLTGRGEIVGCADSGADYNSCFFNGKNDIPETRKVYQNNKKIIAFFTYRSDSVIGDHPDGHGTHVIGTIAGNFEGSSQNQMSKYNGVAKDAKIVVNGLGVANNPKSLSVPRGSIIYKDAKSSGASIHSNSWGTSNPNGCQRNGRCDCQRTNCEAITGRACCYHNNAYNQQCADVDKYLFENKDFFIAFSAGNDGTFADDRTVSSPSTNKNGISVGASPKSNTASMSEFSSRGPTYTDGRFKPDVTQIGEVIISAKSDGSLQVSQIGCSSSNSGNYVLGMRGTSMSTPGVSGAAAIVRQYYREGYHINGKKNLSKGFVPSGMLIKTTIINAGYDRTEEGTVRITRTRKDEKLSKFGYPNKFVGFGKVEIGNNLLIGENTDKKLLVEDMKEIKNEEVHKYIFQSKKDGSYLKVTISWYDTPSKTTVSKALNNDIDMKGYMNDDSSRIYYPNGKNSIDSVNNVEQIEFKNVTKGDIITIEVQGKKIVTLSPNKIEYALVASGTIGKYVKGKEEEDISITLNGAEHIHNSPIILILLSLLSFFLN